MTAQEPYGWELLLDLKGCDLEAIQDGGRIREFVVRLCDDILGMRRFGEPFAARFGEADPKTAGYSVVQLIETSSVVGHFSEERRSAYLDVFSCRSFDPEKVEAFAREFFGAEDAERRFVVRE